MMIVSYCKHCERHSTVEIEGHMHSRCLKENCLVIYSRFLTQKAVEKFLREDKDPKKELGNSALDICYPTA
jgi:hypothetical protein